jgi:hypothetical protein
MSMVDRILVDWDIPFREFKRKYVNAFNGRAKMILDGNLKSIGYVRSSSGNTHIVVYLSEPIPERDAVIYAALMGSDFRRECLNWRRLHCMGNAESWFFNDYRQKGKGKKSMSPVGLKKFIEVNCPDLPSEMVKTVNEKMNEIWNALLTSVVKITGLIIALGLTGKIPKSIDVSDSAHDNPSN